jgi:hypothetical protein
VSGTSHRKLQKRKETRGSEGASRSRIGLSQVHIMLKQAIHSTRASSEQYWEALASIRCLDQKRDDLVHRAVLTQSASETGTIHSWNQREPKCVALLGSWPWNRLKPSGRQGKSGKPSRKR